MNELDQYLANQQTNSDSSTNELDQYLANQNSTPDDVKAAKADSSDQNFNGWCQAFVEQATGSKVKYPSAIDAWNAQKDKAVPTTIGMKPGDLVYFSPNDSNEGNGHTGIYEGNNQFISATDKGVIPYDLTDWQKLTGQSILGYIPQGASQ